jgi:two-component system sensor histidine kinase RegB
MPAASAPLHDAPEPRELATTLAVFRLCAVAGQSLTVAVVAGPMRLPLPVAPLWLGIGALAAFAALAFWRLRRPAPVRPLEVVGHVAVDTAVLGWLLYWTGGAANPFVSLLLIPTTLAASALALRHVAMVAALSAVTYLALLRWHLPLVSVHSEAGGGDFNLHVLGMAVSFAISTLMLGYFVGRLARTLRARREEVQLVRERALRDAGILAIATQAAGAAHELNTPLSTMRTLLGELRREHAQGDLAEDLALLDAQVERCRESLRDLVAVGKAELADTREATTFGHFVEGCLSRFHLLRPEVDVRLQLDEGAAALALAVPYGLRHALINLLNNAAEASLANGHDSVELRAQRAGERLQLLVRDHGAGSMGGSGVDRTRLGRTFASSKSAGLGIGFALADATAERLGGTLSLHPSERGSDTLLSVPLAALAWPRRERAVGSGES